MMPQDKDLEKFLRDEWENVENYFAFVYKSVGLGKIARPWAKGISDDN